MNYFCFRCSIRVVVFFVLAINLIGCDSSSNDTSKGKKSTLVAHKTYKCEILYPAVDTLIGLQDSFKVALASSYEERTLDSVKVYLDKVLIFEDTVLSFNVDLSKLDLGGGKKIIKVEAFYNDGIKGIARRMVYLTAGFKPKLFSYKVEKEYKHNPTYYTQGLIYYNDFMYEGTGGWGNSFIRKLSFPDGEVLLEKKIDSRFFGEGITIFKNRIYQLTYKSQRGFVYDLESFEPVREFSFSGEGWGLTNDSTSLIMSDGTEYIRYLDPETFSETRRIAVVDDQGPIDNINELEYINGEIYANVYLTHKILRIDPKTGEVKAIAHMEGLLNANEIRQADYFNGIAYDAKSDKLFVTGKLWPKMFEIK